MKKIVKGIISSIIIVLLFMIMQAHVVLADVGSFESYDSGSDWGDSDWGSSSWSGSDWDSDWDSDGGIYIIGGSGGFGGIVFRNHCYHHFSSSKFSKRKISK